MVYSLILFLVKYANYNNNIILANTPPNLLSHLHTQLSPITCRTRKFYEITVVYDKASIAISILGQISEMYKIESEIRGLDPGERMKYRQQKSKELVEKLFNDFRKYKKDLPVKSPTAKAINYALNNEAALRRFLDDGKIEIDNNAAERAMRPIAVGRKNWMFAGSDNGGHTAAGIYSLI